MKKLFIRLSVVTLAAILSLGMLSVSAATGSDDGIVSFSSVRGDINGDGKYNAEDLSELRIMLLNM